MASSIFVPEKPVSDSFQAFLVQGAYFTPEEEYPILTSTMIAKEMPKRIMPFNKAINYRGDLSETFICSFSADESFERVRRNPQRYIDFYKRTAGIIGFDYSILSDMPIIKQKKQMDDNLSLTYYYGSQGILVIPNLRCGVDELTDEYLKAIPKNVIIAVGTHGFIKTKQEQYEWYCFIEKVLDELNPSGIVVYGSLTDKMFDELKTRTEFSFYKPWIYTKGKEESKNGN